MDGINIRYCIDTDDQLKESIEKAKQDFDRLISEGYKFVRIVVSRHPYSEGVWVEAGDNESSLSAHDHVYKTNQ